MQQYCEGSYPLVYGYKDLLSQANDGQTYFNVIESYQNTLLIGGRTNDYGLYREVDASYFGSQILSDFKPLIAIIKNFDTNAPSISESFIYGMSDNEITDFEVDESMKVLIASVQDIQKQYSLNILKINLADKSILSAYKIEADKPLKNSAQSMILVTRIPNRLYIQGSYNDRYVLVGFYNIDSPSDQSISITFQDEKIQHQVQQVITTSDKNYIISIGNYMIDTISYGFIQLVNLSDGNVTTWENNEQTKLKKLYIEGDISSRIIFAGFDSQLYQFQIASVINIVQEPSLQMTIYYTTISQENLEIIGITNINGTGSNKYAVLCQTTNINTQEKFLAVYLIEFGDIKYQTQKLVDMSSTSNQYTDMKAFGLLSIYYIGQGSNLGQYSPNLTVESQSKFGIVSKFVFDKDDYSVIFRQSTFTMQLDTFESTKITYTLQASTNVCQQPVNCGTFSLNTGPLINSYKIYDESQYLQQLQSKIIKDISEAVKISTVLFHQNLQKTEDDVFTTIVYFDCLNLDMRDQEVSFNNSLDSIITFVKSDSNQSVNIIFTYPTTKEGGTISFNYSFKYRNLTNSNAVFSKQLEVVIYNPCEDAMTFVKDISSYSLTYSSYQQQKIFSLQNFTMTDATKEVCLTNLEYKLYDKNTGNQVNSNYPMQIIQEGFQLKLEFIDSGILSENITSLQVRGVHKYYSWIIVSQIFTVTVKENQCKYAQVLQPIDKINATIQFQGGSEYEEVLGTLVWNANDSTCEIYYECYEDNLRLKSCNLTYFLVVQQMSQVEIAQIKLLMKPYDMPLYDKDFYIFGYPLRSFDSYSFTSLQLKIDSLCKSDDYSWSQEDLNYLIKPTGETKFNLQQFTHDNSQCQQINYSVLMGLSFRHFD
eukprot:403351060